MDRSIIIFSVYVVFLLVLNGLIAATPMIAFSDEAFAQMLYSGFSYTCHQKLSRSLCLFEDNSISDCTLQGGEYMADDRDIISVERNGLTGYKFPVCSRDVGLYFFMLVGAIAYALMHRMEEKRMYPPIFLVLAVIPLALDGGLQFLSDLGLNLLGFAYESTNLTRLVTGGIAGVAVSFYAIPILNRMFD